MCLFNYSVIYHQAKTFHNLNLQDSSKRMDQKPNYKLSETMYSLAYVRTAKRFHKALYMVASIAKANDANCNVTPALSIAVTFHYASHVLEPKWVILVFSWQLCTKRLKTTTTE